MKYLAAALTDIAFLVFIFFVMVNFSPWFCLAVFFWRSDLIQAINTDRKKHEPEGETQKQTP